jgi:hypothetical protein
MAISDSARAAEMVPPRASEGCNTAKFLEQEPFPGPAIAITQTARRRARATPEAPAEAPAAVAGA